MGVVASPASLVGATLDDAPITDMSISSLNLFEYTLNFISWEIDLARKVVYQFTNKTATPPGAGGRDTPRPRHYHSPEGGMTSMPGVKTKKL